ncbi:MAG TPA: sugar ABC transporter ATP-binding protein [Coriobacteriia bacterium]|nr:sugar ABC transporter ATP-binding protein [Coriobacteriia bacterium]
MGDALRLQSISKSFGSTLALRDVDITVQAGTLHSLIGENGAGKSTLLNIVHGLYADYDGQVELFGVPVHFKTPFDAIRAGISKVHQEIQIVPELTVGHNIALGSEGEHTAHGLLNRTALYGKTDEILERLRCTFRSSAKASGLTVGQIQMVAIAKSLYRESKIISLDEPTASLSDRETQILFGVIQTLLESGMTIIYVSHRLDEVMALSDRISILRDGVVMGTWRRGELERSVMIEKMVGRELEAVFERRPAADGEHGSVALSVKGLSSESFDDIDFDVRKGEILGFAGLVGSGRTEVVETVFGVRHRAAGEIAVNGTPVSIKSPADAMEHGIALIPEDRKRAGFVQNLDNKMNMFLPLFRKRRSYLVRDKVIRANYSRYRQLLRINPDDPDYLTAELSGGNQQKVIVAKWLGTDADILILDEPTKGIDIGAKSEMYALIRSLARGGKAIVVVSSELPELLALSHRILVMHEGRKTVELINDDLDEQTVLHYAMGGLS